MYNHELFDYTWVDYNKLSVFICQHEVLLSVVNFSHEYNNMSIRVHVIYSLLYEYEYRVQSTEFNKTL